MASPSSRSVIRWGIIGCGDVTEVKSGPGFQKARGSQLVAVMRRNGVLAADYARRHGVPRWYDDARALAADPEVDAIYVATPPGAHMEGVLIAAAAGKPVYVEKPMARNTTECETMIRACAAAGQKLYVAYYRRAMPRFLKIKELLDSGAIGTLTGLHHRFASPGHAGTATIKHSGPQSASWRAEAGISGGGLLLDIGAHAVDLLDYYGGPLQSVSGHAARVATPGHVEDTAAMTFLTASGAPGTATWNFASLIKEDLLEVSGTAGRITCAVFNHDPIRFETARGVEHFEFPAPEHIAQPLIQTVVDDLLGVGTCPSTGETALRSTAVIDRILDAYYGGRQDAFWDRPATWPGNKPSTGR